MPPVALVAVLLFAACAPAALPSGGRTYFDGGGRLAWPVRGVIFSPFGMRNGRLHAGLDISAPEGTPIRAAADGVVTQSDDRYSGYGNLVLVDHGNGIVTAYAHNAENLVAVGARVARGEVIALVGATGNATGPHVHFEVRRAGRAVNPRPYLGR